MQRPGRRAELVVAALLAAIAVGLALGRLPSLVHLARASLAQQPESLADSDISPLGYYVPPETLRELRARIPAGALYTEFNPDGDIALLPVVKLLLLPRRYTPEPRDAQWVVLYSVPASEAKIAYRKEFQLPDGWELLEAGR